MNIPIFFNASGFAQRTGRNVIYGTCEGGWLRPCIWLEHGIQKNLKLHFLQNHPNFPHHKANHDSNKTYPFRSSFSKKFKEFTITFLSNSPPVISQEPLTKVYTVISRNFPFAFPHSLPNSNSKEKGESKNRTKLQRNTAFGIPPISKLFMNIFR